LAWRGARSKERARDRIETRRADRIDEQVIHRRRAHRPGRTRDSTSSRSNLVRAAAAGWPRSALRCCGPSRSSPTSSAARFGGEHRQAGARPQSVRASPRYRASSLLAQKVRGPSRKRSSVSSTPDAGEGRERDSRKRSRDRRLKMLIAEVISFGEGQRCKNVARSLDVLGGSRYLERIRRPRHQTSPSGHLLRPGRGRASPPDDRRPGRNNTTGTDRGVYGRATGGRSAGPARERALADLRGAPDWRAGARGVIRTGVFVLDAVGCRAAPPDRCRAARCRAPRRSSRARSDAVFDRAHDSRSGAGRKKKLRGIQSGRGDEHSATPRLRGPKANTRSCDEEATFDTLVTRMFSERRPRRQARAVPRTRRSISDAAWLARRRAESVTGRRARSILAMLRAASRVARSVSRLMRPTRALQIERRDREPPSVRRLQ